MIRLPVAIIFADYRICSVYGNADTMPDLSVVFEQNAFKQLGEIPIIINRFSNLNGVKYILK